MHKVLVMELRENCLNNLLKTSGPVVQGLDNNIHQISHYPVDKCWQSKLRYPLHSDLSAA